MKGFFFHVLFVCVDCSAAAAANIAGQNYNIEASLNVPFWIVVFFSSFFPTYTTFIPKLLQPLLQDNIHPLHHPFQASIYEQINKRLLTLIL